MLNFKTKVKFKHRSISYGTIDRSEDSGTNLPRFLYQNIWHRWCQFDRFQLRQNDHTVLSNHPFCTTGCGTILHWSQWNTAACNGSHLGLSHGELSGFTCWYCKEPLWCIQALPTSLPLVDTHSERPLLIYRRILQTLQVFWLPHVQPSPHDKQHFLRTLQCRPWDLFHCTFHYNIELR